MNDEQRLAYAYAMIACANIESAGMQAENRQREVSGYSPAYTEHHFNALIEKYGIHHNAVITQLVGH